MSVPQPQAELEALLASRIALIVIQSKDERRVLELVQTASLRVHRPRGWGVFQWSVTGGLTRVDMDLGGSQKHLCDPQELLKHIKVTHVPGNARRFISKTNLSSGTFRSR